MKAMQVFTRQIEISTQESNYLTSNINKTINQSNFPNCIEHVSIVEQTVCTSRQLTFKIFRNNKRKIGMNMTANKFYCISDQISMDSLNLTFVHFKKLAKIQFLKYGRT